MGKTIKRGTRVNEKVGIILKKRFEPSLLRERKSTAKKSINWNTIYDNKILTKDLNPVSLI